MESTEDFFQRWRQIERVEAVRLAAHQKTIRDVMARQQSQFEIFGSLPITLLAEPIYQLMEFTRISQQGFTVI
jgi:hypothetical protein